MSRAPRVILAGPNPLVESLQWNDAAQEKPDAMETVLTWTADVEYPYECGYWDGEQWLSDHTGSVLAGVTHWAQPQGPQA